MVGGVKKNNNLFCLYFKENYTILINLLTIYERP